MEEFNHWYEIAGQYEAAVTKVVRKTAKNIAKEAKATCPVATGFLKRSIYSITSDQGLMGKDEAGEYIKTGFSSTRRKKVPKRKEHLRFPEIPPPSDDKEAYAVVGAIYGVFVNYGTRFMEAQPFWEPAIDTCRAQFEEDLSKIEDSLQVNMTGSIDVL